MYKTIHINNSSNSGSTKFQYNVIFPQNTFSIKYFYNIRFCGSHEINFSGRDAFRGKVVYIWIFPDLAKARPTLEDGGVISFVTYKQPNNLENIISLQF